MVTRDTDDRDPRCRDCRAPVTWLANDTTGKVAPIDAEPSDAGNVTIDLDAGTYTVWGKGTAPEGLTRYTSHFATCPNAARFRGRR